MDKLEPILKQKFWIILGIGVILTVTGWWMATSSLAATISTRKAAIDSAEKGIPSGEMPNADWAAKLSKINEQQEAMVTSVRRKLWEQQAETMFWPETMQEFAAELPYRGEFGLVARDLYRSSYLIAVEDVWKQARPIDLDGSGVVLFPRQAMPMKKTILGDLAPRSEDIWDAQEDLWLLTPLLQAIREVNGGENATRLDASVHVIERLELLGGERTTGESSSSGSADSGGGADMSAMMGGGMNGGGGGAAAGKVLSADFSPEEEFGPTGREGRSGGGGMGAMSMMSAAEPGASTDGAPTIKRYVDDDPSAPFKTRAFYMLVVMDHRKVPRLLAELTAGGSSAWPVEIMRMQMSRVNPDDAEGRAGGVGNPMASMGGAGMISPMPADFTSESSGAAFADGGGAFPATGNTPQVSLDTAMQDPVIARVAIAGLIYLYRPVEAPPEASAEPSADGTQPAVAESPTSETPNSEAMPADVAATPADPAAEPTATTDPAAPADSPAPAPAAAPGKEPEATKPSPGDTPPAAPAEPAPASGAPPAATPAAPPQPETP